MLLTVRLDSRRQALVNVGSLPQPGPRRHGRSPGLDLRGCGATGSELIPCSARGYSIDARPEPHALRRMP